MIEICRRRKNYIRKLSLNKCEDKEEYNKTYHIICTLSYNKCCEKWREDIYSVKRYIYISKEEMHRNAKIC